jgi:hypothetical protein
VALCGARGGDLRAADFSAPTPPGLQIPKVWPDRVGVLKSVKFTELCSFDSESSEKKILLTKYVFLLRSSNPFDRWLCLPPPQHGPYDLGQLFSVSYRASTGPCPHC